MKIIRSSTPLWTGNMGLGIVPAASGMSIVPQVQAVNNLYEEARKRGLLYDPEVRLLIQSLIREPDPDYYAILKERVERARRAELLCPNPFQKDWPTKEEAQGEIQIGRVVGQGYEYGIDTKDRHWMPLGATGSGKSYLIRKILKVFLKTGKRCFVFSKKRDTRSIASLFSGKVVLFRLVEKNFRLNPKQGGPGISLLQANTDFVSAFCQSYALLVGSESYLIATLAELDLVLNTFKDITRQASLLEIRHYVARQKHTPVGREARYQESLLNRLDGLLCMLGEVFACSQGFPIEQVLTEGYSIILEVDGVPEEVALFVITIITLRLFTWMLFSESAKPEEINLFLDDSQEIWNVNLERRYETGLPFMGVMAARFREAGLIVASTQTPSLTSMMLRQNCSTKIALKQNNYEEALASARSVGLPDSQAVELMRLKTGEAICFKSAYPYPVKVRIAQDPDIEEKRGATTINMSLIEKTREEFLQRYPSSPSLGLRPSAPGVDNRDVLVLANIYTTPFLGVDVRSDKLGMSSMMLRRVLGGLEAKGWIQLVRFSMRTRGYVRYCNITEDGIKSVKLKMPEEGSGSFLHRKFQAYLRNLFLKKGLQARIEYALNGKRVDVGFLDNEKHVAIECGLSNAENELNNIVKDLTAGFHEVRILCRDSDMLKKLQELLSKTPLQKGGIPKLELLTDYLQCATADTETATAQDVKTD